MMPTTEDHEDEALQERVAGLVRITYATLRGDHRDGSLPTELLMHWDDLTETYKDVLLKIGLACARQERAIRTSR
jgi:hypothetical protein